MIQNNKEFYLTRDVYRDVSEKLNISPKIVEEVFTSFLKSFKTNIENTDDILYDLPHLGEMMINKTDALRELNKYKKRSEREKNPVEKERLKNVCHNYRVRIKKIRIEIEKIKKRRGFMHRSKRSILYSRKFGISTPENIKRRKNFKGLTLDEVMKRQNDYAYKFYKENNSSVVL